MSIIQVFKQSTLNITLDRHVYVRGALFQFRIIYNKSYMETIPKMYNLRSDNTEKETKKKRIS